MKPLRFPPTRQRASGLLLGLCLSLVALWRTNAVEAQITLPNLGDNLNIAIPLAQERRIGSELMAQLASRLSLIDDPLVLEYFHALAQRLVNSSDKPHRTVQVYINDAPEFNAMALPGGHVILNLGLLLMADTESQMVSVLGHEIAHVHKRHSARLQQQMQQLQLVGIASALAAVLAASQDPTAAQAILYSGAGLQHQQLFNYSRQHEQQADDYGHQMMVKAGFDPQGMSELFERMARQNHSQFQAPEYLSTHPLTNDRIADAQERRQRLAQQQSAPIAEEADYGLIRARVASLSQHPNQPPLSPEGQLYRRALEQLKAGKLNQAKRAYQALSQSAVGDNPIVLHLKATLEQAAGQTDKALQTLNDAQAIYPTRFSLAHARSQQLLETGQTAQAAALLSDFLAHTPAPLPSAWRYAAELHGQAEQTAKALHYAAEHLYARGQRQAAIQTLHQAIAKSRSDSERRALEQRLRDWPSRE